MAPVQVAARAAVRVPSRLRRARSRRSAVVGVTAVVILAAAGIGAYAATGSSGPRYRTATVAMASVARTLAETGTAEQQTSDDASFASAGTVSSVDVTAGEHVTAGQTLATLDTTSLVAALNAAKETTAEARLTLTEAEDGTLSSTRSSGGTSGSTSGSTGSFGGSTTADTTSATASLLATQPNSTVVLAADVVPTATASGRPTGGGTGTKAPTGTSTSALAAAVVAGQHALDSDLATAKALLAKTTAACASTPDPSPTTTTPSTSPSTSPSTTSSTSPSPQPTAGTGKTCAADEAGLLQAEQRVGADETSLASAETGLDTALEKAATTSTSTGTTRTTTGTSGKSSSSSGSASTTTTVTAAQLAAYEAKVDAAVAAQAVAQQDLQLATLTSPLTGTVLSVDLTAGSSSSGGGITVAAPDGVVYTTSLPVDTVEGVAVGQAATILPDGTSTSLPAKVVAVAAAPDSSGDYSVTVGLDTPKAGIRTGATAALTITTASAGDVLTVPTSAITSVGTLHVVRVLKGSTLTAVPVTITVQGPVRTQVTGSLAVGEKVVLADLSAAVPASNSDTTTTRTGGLGGTTTGGFGDGGAAGFGGGTGRRGG